MPDWQQSIYDKYIVPGKTVVQIDETLNGINLNGLWNNLKEMMSGRMNAAKVLESWDEDFSEQMRYQKENS